ncbi:MAG: hypothetical protein R2681_05375 [Pyrinomonadaceae bacterium]
METTDRSVTAEINLYYDLFIPENAEPNAPLLITVHGYAAHKGYMMREAKLIAPANFVIASLQAPNKFFRESKDGEYKLAFGWLNDFKPEESVALHHKFVLDVIDKLAEAGTIDPKNVYLHGFSQACALNFRFAFTNPKALKGIIGICGGIPSDLETSEKYSETSADVLYVYGNDDIFYTQEKFENYAARLKDFAPNLHTQKYTGGHEITQEMRADIKQWLAMKKQQVT